MARLLTGSHGYPEVGSRGAGPVPARGRLVWALGAWLALSVGCGVATPVPERGTHLATEPFVPVSKPPETVEVQVLGPRPDDQSVWVDGQWQWSGRRWTWQEGAWVRPPEGGRYAPPDLVLTPVADYEWVLPSDAGAGHWEVRGYRAELQYRPGRWYGGDGGEPTQAPAGKPDAGP